MKRLTAADWAGAEVCADMLEDMASKPGAAVNVVLFDDFETLDVFGPVEVIGRLPGAYRLGFYSLGGGLVASAQNVRVHTLPSSEADPSGVLLVPGGRGTRSLVDDPDFTARLLELAQQASYILAVCTGAALLARTGVLDGRRATSNKLAFDWVTSTRPQVDWVRRARWVKDGTVYTSSGVSAGIDMALGFIADRHGVEIAQGIANHIEYVWNPDAGDDPFAPE